MQSKSDTVLREACIEANNQILDEYIAKIENEPMECLSKKERKQMVAFLRKLDGNSKKVKHIEIRKAVKIALVAIIVLVFFSIAAFAIEPFRDFIFSYFKESTDITFGVNENANDFLYAQYTYVPDGYKLVEDKQEKNCQSISFSNDDGNSIFIYTTKNKDSVSSLDTENDASGTTVINGLDAFYIIGDKGITLVWNSGKYHHSIFADYDKNGEITIEALIKIVESRKEL
ncbi:MAG: DUF4367 domain-containing protein [Oscillospiraceae bacterium]|nr:DUF4367 domain-containing protein [Candidatus Limimonas egerieequi]